MNIMQDMKHARGVAGMREKNKVSGLFFSFSTVWKAVLSSFSFTKFINLVMRRGLMRFTESFMNFMKIYEGGVFMANFEKAVLLGGPSTSLRTYFMNFRIWLPSLKFINQERLYEQR